MGTLHDIYQDTTFVHAQISANLLCCDVHRERILSFQFGNLYSVQIVHFKLKCDTAYKGIVASDGKDKAHMSEPPTSTEVMKCSSVLFGCDAFRFASPANKM